MQVGKDDIIKKNITEKIKECENLLLNNYLDMTKNVNEKQFLIPILKEYQDYYQLITQDNLKQINILNEIDEHLEKVKENSILSTEELFNLENDKKEILNRVKKLEKELETINS